MLRILFLISAVVFFDITNFSIAFNQKKHNKFTKSMAFCEIFEQIDDLQDFRVSDGFVKHQLAAPKVQQTGTRKEIAHSFLQACA